MPDTEALLQDWKAKTDAATKGPWRETYPNSRVIDSDEQIIVDSFNDGVGAGVIEHPDAEFIAMSRTAMQRLLAAVEAIRALHYDAGASQGYGKDGYGVIDHCCSECGTLGEYGVEWPCDTIRALDAALSGSEPDDRGGK